MNDRKHPEFQSSAPETLEKLVMDPNVPKSEAEWWACREITRLRAALRFYAEPYKYTDIHGDDIQVPDFYSETDFGETARLALEGKP